MSVKKHKKEETMSEIIDKNKDEEFETSGKYGMFAHKLRKIPELSQLFEEMSKDEKDHAENFGKMGCLVENINMCLKVNEGLETKVPNRHIQSIPDLLTILDEHPDIVQQYLKSCKLQDVI